MIPRLTTEILSIDDGGLPSLLSEVAVDLDNLLAGRCEYFEAMDCLGYSMHQSVRHDCVGKAFSNMDFVTTYAIEKTLFDITGVSETSALLGKITDIADALTNRAPVDERVQLEIAQTFCLNFSQGLIAYGESGRIDLGVF